MPVKVMDASSQNVSIPDAIKLALRYHHANELSKAESIYRQVLAVEPEHPDALQLLGVIANQSGHHEAAIDLIGRSIQVHPQNPYAYNNIGEAFRALKRLDEALESYQKALVMLPLFPEAWNNLGNTYRSMLQSVEAENCYRKALEIQPAYAEAYNNLGNLFKDRGDLENSVLSYQQAIRLKPDYPEAYCNLGNVFQDQGRPEEAMACYHEALARRPNYADALNNLGVTLLRRHEYDKAATCFRNALVIRPNYPDAQLNLGNVYKETRRFGEAITCYRRALEMDPQFAGAYNNLGNVYKEMGEHVDAIGAYRKALCLRPDFPAARWNLSLELLLSGNYVEGFENYEFRFRGGDKDDFFLANAMLDWLADVPRWGGNELRGRSLLLWTEQGQGDSLMMMRYLPLLVERGVGRLLVYCEPSLKRLFAAQPGVDEAIGRDVKPALEGIDFHCPMLSLPKLFCTCRETVPANIPYLRMPDEMVSQWKARLSNEPRLRVGLVWAGGQALRYDAKRSLALKQFEPLFEVSGAVFFSLQKGTPAAQVVEAAWPIIDWMDDCEDFLDTAGLVQNLDLVISVDTAVAHLAGALGKPVWLLNRFESEWRWMLNRDDSPWYPTLRQFRQTLPGEWGDVIECVAETLAEQLSGAGLN